MRKINTDKSMKNPQILQEDNFNTWLYLKISEDRAHLQRKRNVNHVHQRMSNEIDTLAI